LLLLCVALCHDLVGQLKTATQLFNVKYKIVCTVQHRTWVILGTVAGLLTVLGSNRGRTFLLVCIRTFTRQKLIFPQQGRLSSRGAEGQDGIEGPWRT